MKFKSLALTAVLSVGTAFSAVAEEKVLNIYNWSDYFDPAYLKKFEEKTGIKVNYDVYDSNEVLEAKLMAGGSGYDVVVPTGAFLERQIQAGIYSKVDKASLSNYGNLDAGLKKAVEDHDAGNTYGVPYTWGTIGIAYNMDMLAERFGGLPNNSWDLLFKPEMAAKVKDCGIGVLDSPAEMVSIALNYLGLDPNSEKKGDLKKAQELFNATRANIKYFNSSKTISDLANGEICMAIGYNGDMLQAQSRAQEAKNGINVDYVIPSEGSLAWFDLMAIPADAPHKEAAHKFIDFVLEPETGASIANFVFYAVANKAATPHIVDEVKANAGIYPAEKVKAKLFAQKAHTAKFDRLLSRAWTAIKTGR
ncbi:polyamine ABC transporter substrate-binding protein [Terasakiella sp. SH-1]|uniref:polyamine ABC transporter substrate-binding protein n=1 Tax=Terasakiella sp. SH-1 TaxID=2560057 RepID=UPI001072F50F|nr:polyamine ABC transporter substrate-binding protein [Terasakiella sp. SH-1]